jgi:hypothetical protein
MISTTSYWQKSRSGGKGESHMAAVRLHRAQGTTLVKHVLAGGKKTFRNRAKSFDQSNRER